MLCPKIKNAVWVAKMTTTCCGIRAAAITRNFVSWMFLNTTRCGMWRSAMVQNSCRGCKKNDHNAFQHLENTTTHQGHFLLQPWRDLRQVSTCQRVHVVCLQLASDWATSWCFYSHVCWVWRRFLMTKWGSWMMQAVIGAYFLIMSATIKFYGKLKMLGYCERITSHWLRNITGVLKGMMSWRSVICRNLLEAVHVKMMIQAFIITARWRSCLMSWKRHMST